MRWQCASQALNFLDSIAFAMGGYSSKRGGADTIQQLTANG